MLQNAQAANLYRLLLTHQPRSQTTASELVVSGGVRGGHVIISVCVAVYAPDLTPIIEGYEPSDPDYDGYYPILIGDPITDSGRTVLKVYPGLTPVPGLTANDVLPARWRLRMQHATSESVQYSAAFNGVI